MNTSYHDFKGARMFEDDFYDLTKGFLTGTPQLDESLLSEEREEEFEAEAWIAGMSDGTLVFFVPKSDDSPKAEAIQVAKRHNLELVGLLP